MKIIFLIVYAWIGSAPLLAQIVLGAKAGLNVADFRSSDSRFDYTTKRLSYHLGGFMELKFAKKLGVNVEILYSEKGAKLTFARTKYNPDIVILPYISLPLIFSYSPWRFIHLKIGPEIGYLLDPIKATNGIYYYTSDYNKKWDLGIDIEVSFKIKKIIGIGARYNYGLLAVDEITVVDGIGDNAALWERYKVKYYNTVLQLFISYDFLTLHRFSEAVQKLKL